jgi:branched-chain amino acid transport system ATP-binding protein
LLEATGIETFYGASQILFGVSLTVREGQVVTLLGRNGMGKTTTVKSIMGVARYRSGRVSFAGQDLTGRRSYEVARAGIAYVPEGRHVFPNLTVRENIVATERHTPQQEDPWTYEKVLGLFPALRERAEHSGNALSGGEQQMVAISRALMTNPRLLILDEATEGLAPMVRSEIWRCLDNLSGTGLAILVIDKNIEHLLTIADHHYILEKGEVVWQGDSPSLRTEKQLLEQHLGL